MILKRQMVARAALFGDTRQVSAWLSSLFRSVICVHSLPPFLREGAFANVLAKGSDENHMPCTKNCFGGNQAFLEFW